MSSPPKHWVPLAGPNSWYTVWHPPTWRVETMDGTVSLAAPDNAGLLTISSFWLEGARSDATDKLLDVARLFPIHRRVRVLPALNGKAVWTGCEGEAPLGPRQPWWRRWLQRTRWRPWRLWYSAHEALHALALFLQNDHPDPEAGTMASLILGTLVFNHHPPVPPEVFASRVLDLARRKFPLLECEPAPDFQLKLGESRVNLFNFYRSYVNSPDQFEAIILPALTTVVQVQGWGRRQTDPALEDVRERIMPMLYPEDVWRDRFPTFIGEPWVGGLVILYVVDESQAYWYIRQDLLDAWNMTQDELHRLALANLDRYFEDQPMEFTLAGEEQGPRLLIPIRPDAYNTARLLSEQFHFKLRDVLGGDFVVGIPSRDFFVAVSLESTETVDHVSSKVNEDFKQMDHPLTDRLLLVTCDGVTEYAPW